MQRQDQPEFSRTISDSRHKIITQNHLERISQEEALNNRSMDDLTEQDESNFYNSGNENDSVYSYGGRQGHQSSKAEKEISLKKLDRKSDQMFFEFFGMYTKESIKSQNRTG